MYRCTGPAETAACALEQLIDGRTQPLVDLGILTAVARALRLLHAFCPASQIRFGMYPGPVVRI